MGNTKGVHIELSKKEGATARDMDAVASWLNKHLETGTVTFLNIEGEYIKQVSELESYKTIEKEPGKLTAEGITSWGHFEDELVLEAAKHKMYGKIRVHDFDNPSMWVILIPEELTYKEALEQKKTQEKHLEQIVKEATARYGEGLRA